MKRLLIILIIVAVSLATLGIFKDLLVKSAVTILLTNVTGAKIHIDSLSFGLFNSKVKIKGFKIYNPKGFPEGVLLNLEDINVHYDLGGLLGKRIYLKNVFVDLKEVVVIRDKEGKLNVDSLKISKSEKAADKPVKKTPMRIDILTLSLGRVIYEDFSRAEKPSIEAFNIGIKERVYKNITTAEQLIALFLVESLKSTTIKSAQIYGAASIIGASMLPVGLGYLFTRSDEANENFRVGFDKVYASSERALKYLGGVTKENKSRGEIEGRIGLTDISVRITKLNPLKTKVMVSARKFLLPEPRIAGGLLYRISEELKTP